MIHNIATFFALIIVIAIGTACCYALYLIVELLFAGF